MNRNKHYKAPARIAAYRLESPSASEFFEGCLYEIKPILYTAFAIWILHSHMNDAWWIKISSLGILVFGVLTAFSRLTYRGYLE